jgi:5-methylthioadenosine/S-adenosylhomocysteine deaminase
MLIADYFPDNDRKFNPFGVLMGTTMMASHRAGLHLHHEQFQGWIATPGSAGAPRRAHRFNRSTWPPSRAEEDPPHVRTAVRTRARERVDTLVKGRYVVTMNATATSSTTVRWRCATARSWPSARRQTCSRATTADARGAATGSCVTPGMVNTHIHITGEPAHPRLRPRRHAVRGERVRVALPAVRGVPRRRGAPLRPARRGGDAEVGHHHVPRGRHDPLPRRGGRRPRRGRHPWPRRPMDVGPAARARRVPADHRPGHRQPGAFSSDGHLSHDDGRIGSWSILVGHTTCVGSAVEGRVALADEHGVGLSFHMSPAKLDPKASSPSSASGRWCTSPSWACWRANVR